MDRGFDLSMNHYETSHSERLVLYNPYHVAIHPASSHTCDQINSTKVGFVNEVNLHYVMQYNRA